MISLRAGMVTDTGRIRSINQDSLLVLEHLAVVADGMGGHRGGEVASQVAVDSMAVSWKSGTSDDLVEGVRTANRDVIGRASADPELRGMGTTLVAAGLVGLGSDTPTLAVVNVGDSRAYLLVDEGVEQLTIDHSLVEGLVRSGRISREEALVHPQRSIVTRALGIDTEVDVDLFERPAAVGDRVLLCSDGLSNEVAEPLIASVLQRFDDPAEAASELVRLANERGGRDNVTCVVIDLVGDDLFEGVRPGARTQPAVPDAAGFQSAGPDTLEYAPLDVDADPDAEVADAERASDTLRTIAASPASIRLAEKNDDYRPPRVTWRSLLFALALVVVAAVAFGGTAWYARSGWFVGEDAGMVVIYQGRPGGVLWIDPTIDEVLPIEYQALNTEEKARVDAEQEFSSRADAETFISDLCDAGDRCEP